MLGSGSAPPAHQHPLQTRPRITSAPSTAPPRPGLSSRSWPLIASSCHLVDTWLRASLGQPARQHEGLSLSLSPACHSVQAEEQKLPPRHHPSVTLLEELTDGGQREPGEEDAGGQGAGPPVPTVPVHGFRQGPRPRPPQRGLRGSWVRTRGPANPARGEPGWEVGWRPAGSTQSPFLAARPDGRILAHVGPGRGALGRGTSDKHHGTTAGVVTPQAQLWFLWLQGCRRAVPSQGQEPAKGRTPDPRLILMGPSVCPGQAGAGLRGPLWPVGPLRTQCGQRPESCTCGMALTPFSQCWTGLSVQPGPRRSRMSGHATDSTPGGWGARGGQEGPGQGWLGTRRSGTRAAVDW